MGLGRFGGGVGVARWLAEQGAQVTITDLQPAEKLERSLAKLDGLPVRLHLGRHQEADFREADLVVVNPAVKDGSAFLEAARNAGTPITTEINLFVERCPARIVGVTGSVGKSTIAAMTSHVLRELFRDRNVWLGGNIGESLLGELPGMSADDLVVLELSSFQLQRTAPIRWSPHIAVITNIRPNHLDWHRTFAAYVAAKLNIVRFQNPQRDHVIMEDTPELRRTFDQLLGDLSGLWRFGLDGQDLVAVAQSTPAIDCDDQRLRWSGVELNVPGEHNRRNAAAALTVAHLLGADATAAVAALRSFAALPDRLNRVAVIDNVTYYNDSKSTTPEAAVTAMNAISGPLVIILGGYDKGSDLQPVAEVAARRARFAACIGQTGGRLAELIRAEGGDAELCGDLASAVEACRRRAVPGDAVLLSPACASWDQFEDYRTRGAEFARLVLESVARAS
jgi:UDP-N-acetylmuramoylalanine--D-glutamate ligase